MVLNSYNQSYHISAHPYAAHLLDCSTFLWKRLIQNCSMIAWFCRSSKESEVPGRSSLLPAVHYVTALLSCRAPARYLYGVHMNAVLPLSVQDKNSSNFQKCRAWFLLPIGIFCYLPWSFRNDLVINSLMLELKLRISLNYRNFQKHISTML